MPTKEQLQQEILSGALALELAAFVESGDDGSILATLSRRDIAGKAPIPASQIKKYFSLRGLRIPIKEGTSLPCREATVALEDFESFDINDPYISAKLNDVLDGLIDDVLIPDFTPQDKAVVLSFGSAYISRLEQLGWNISITEIAQALRG